MRDAFSTSSGRGQAGKVKHAARELVAEEFGSYAPAFLA